MNRFVYASANENDTQRLGAALADILPDGVVVGLMGDLGAGKTLLVKSAAKACDIVEEDVASPTFVLCREYQGRRKIFHFDAYRLENKYEFLDLGAEECYPQGLTFIEWADRIADFLPEERIEIHIQITGPTSRQMEIIGPATQADVIGRLSDRLGA